MSTAPRPPAPLRADNQTAWVLRHYVWKRCVDRNEHFMGAVVGREGSGKSHTALKIGELVDPHFSAERVMFDPTAFVERFRDSDLGAGDVVILDEAGVGMGNRSWYEKEQVLLNQVLQTVRDENMAALFTLPALSELDSQTRNRLIAFLELTEKVEGEYVRGKFKRLEIDRGPDCRGIYKKFPRRRVNGRKIKLKSIAFTPPSRSLVEDYEERKQAFKKQLYSEYLDADDDEEATETDLRKLASQVVGDRVEEYVERHAMNKMPYINSDLLALDYDLSKSDAKTVKSLIQQQIDLEEYAPQTET